jgi:hypothetical protein
MVLCVHVLFSLVLLNSHRDLINHLKTIHEGGQQKAGSSHNEVSHIIYSSYTLILYAYAACSSAYIDAVQYYATQENTQ